MSQINDALRRAGYVAKAGPGGPPMPPPAPVSVPPALPILPSSALPPPPLLPGLGNLEVADIRQNKSSMMQIVLALSLIACVFIAAGVTFWEKRNRSSANAKPTAQTGAKTILSEEALIKTRAARPPAPVAPTNAGVPNGPTSAAPGTAATPVVVAAPVTPPRPVEPVKFPPLRLQSIFFRPSSPSVMINNKTLFIDDTIQGVQVADIQPSSVTLVLSGQTNVLTLR